MFVFITLEASSTRIDCKELLSHLQGVSSANTLALPNPVPVSYSANQRACLPAWSNSLIAKPPLLNPAAQVNPHASIVTARRKPCRVPQSAGSRLPAPLAWPLLEAWHPGSQDSGGGGGGGSGRGSNSGGIRAGEGGSDGGAAWTVGAALTWLLGLEAAGSAYLAVIPAGESMIPAGERLACPEQIEGIALVLREHLQTRRGRRLC